MIDPKMRRNSPHLFYFSPILQPCVTMLSCKENQPTRDLADHMADATPVLSVQDLCKHYGAKTAVDNISFEVRRNEIVGLLGPNGAGKTTTINMVLGVLAPTSGTIDIEGIDLAAQRSHAMERTNFAAVYAPLPGNLTIYQNL